MARTCSKACKQDGVYHVVTPLGNEYDCRRMDYGRMALMGKVPNPFAEMAIKAAYKEMKSEDELDLDEIRKVEAYRSWAVSQLVVPALEVDHVHGFTEDGEEVPDAMATEDRDHLARIAFRQEPICEAERAQMERRIAEVAQFRDLIPLLADLSRSQGAANGPGGGSRAQRRSRR